MLPDFAIHSDGTVSSMFLQKEIDSFSEACTCIQQLPYKRNSSPKPELVLEESKGVCSTKHALLKQLCDESGHEEIKLVVGIYKMNEENTKGVGKILDKYGLNEIVEAHSYLKYEDAIYDFTKAGCDLSFTDDLIDEIEWKPEQIGDHKIKVHKMYMSYWLHETGLIEKFSLEEMWKIREECIAALVC
jgi:hypothetical protein